MSTKPATIHFGASHLRCEGHENPLGIDQALPRFSWRLFVSSGRGHQQAAYQLQVATSPELLGKVNVWDSGKVRSNQTFGIAYSGSPILPRQRYFWRLRVWVANHAGSPWSQAQFETGLLNEKWQAKWIGSKRATECDAPPAVELWRRFHLPPAVTQARLYITARGIFSARLNGQAVGADVLTPGWTDFRSRLDYLVYDVTDLLRQSSNILGVTLGDGWWSGFLSEPQFELRYGRDPSLLAQLVFTDAQGQTHWIGTDSNWQVSHDGPVRQNALYHGETFDNRIATPPASTRANRYQHASIFEEPNLILEAKHAPPIRKMELRAACSLNEPLPGIFIFDFGENIVGWARLKVCAPRGTKIRLRFGEMLEPNGSLYTANLRSARATDSYLCGGIGNEEWEPRFTFHGFRYVELIGHVPMIDSLQAVIIHSALFDPAAHAKEYLSGTFHCSDPLINRLQRCIVRGQKGNFLDLPMDCPQRDERLGWSGDAQIFAPTACYNMACGPLFRSWMRSMRDGQREDGAFPDLAPHILLGHGNAGWGDAGIIVPWVVWRHSGDTRILEENFEAMARHLAFLHASSSNLICPETLFGDWLAVDAVQAQFAPTPKQLIGTAYFGRCAKLMSQMARALGQRDRAREYAQLFTKIRRAFGHEFVTRTGRVQGETQTSYLLALGFDLVPANLRLAATEHLVHLLSSRDWHLTTGFLGTPLLAPVLTACGRSDVAYRLLKQETYPSWLYPIAQGATTMWERWDSWTKERGFGHEGMNSFNHYAYGAIGEWLFSTVAGISPITPGFGQVLIAPQPGGKLSWAHAEIEAPNGLIRSHWKIERSRFELRVSIPPNTKAIVRIPSAPNRITENGRRLRLSRGISGIAQHSQSTEITLGSGDYLFCSGIPPDLAIPL